VVDIAAALRNGEVLRSIQNEAFTAAQNEALTAVATVLGKQARGIINGRESATAAEDDEDRGAGSESEVLHAIRVRVETGDPINRRRPDSCVLDDEAVRPWLSSGAFMVSNDTGRLRSPYIANTEHLGQVAQGQWRRSGHRSCHRG
jgi:hypothetical protein